MAYLTDLLGFLVSVQQQAALSTFVQLQQVGVMTLVSNSKPQRAVGQVCFKKASLCTWSQLTVSTHHKARQYKDRAA